MSNLLHNLEEYLKLQRDENFDAVQIRPETLRLFQQAMREQPAAKEAEQSQKPAAKSQPAARPEPARQPAAKKEAKPESEPLPAFSSIEELDGLIRECTRCPLCKTRTQAVTGEGKTSRPDVMFVGEAPVAEDDRSGHPFTDSAGEMLTNMIKAMGYTREDVFITIAVKCHEKHPAGTRNRRPTKAECAACLPWLEAQIRFVQPKTIVALGRVACSQLLNDERITLLRGKWHEYKGIPVMPTFHPAYLEHAPAHKKETWLDLQDVLRKLGRPLPQK